MPLLSAIIAAFFGFVAEILVKRLSIGVAAAAAFIATNAAAFLAVKLALSALAAGVTAVLPTAVTTIAGYFMPSNLSTCLTAILIADAAVTYWEYWKHQLGVAFQLARA